MLGRLIFSQGLANACLVSSTDCGQTGTCRLYDKQVATVNITIIMATGKVKYLFDITTRFETHNALIQQALSALLAGLALLLQSHRPKD